MIIRNKLFRLVLFGAGIAIGAAGMRYWDNYWADRENVEPSKASSIEETHVGEVSGYSTCMKDKDNLDQKLIQKTRDYNTCTVEKSQLQQQFEAASQVSDSRYVAIKAIVESKQSEDRKIALTDLILNYVNKSGGELSVIADGSCDTGLSNLYAMITPIKDDKVKHDFVLMLTEAGMCQSIVPNSKYFKLEAEK